MNRKVVSIVSHLIFYGLLYLSSDTAFSQQKYGEMRVSDPEVTNVIVRSEDRSVLLIISEIPHLSFESTLQIFEIRQITANEWEVVVEPGRQFLIIRAENYLPVETKTTLIQPKRAYNLKVTQIRPVPGNILITSVPDSAAVRIRGEVVGITPYVSDEIEPGEFKIEVEKAGYVTEDTTLTIESNRVTIWEANLSLRRVRVEISIENEIEEVAVFIDDDSIGYAPLETFLFPGNYQLTLKKRGYSDMEKVIDIPVGTEEDRFYSELLARKSAFYKKWWLVTGSLAAIAGGAFVLSAPKKAPAQPLPEPPDLPIRQP
jgi:hypothetical protein